MGASMAKRAETAERRAKAIALRLAGAEWQQIADQLGYYNRGAAYNDVKRALERNRAAEAEQVDAMRHVEALRLDRMQAGLWPKAIRGDEKAVEAVVKLMRHRMQLFGLDAPARVDVTATTVPSNDHDRAQRLAQVAAELAARVATGDPEQILAATIDHQDDKELQ